MLGLISGDLHKAGKSGSNMSDSDIFAILCVTNPSVTVNVRRWCHLVLLIDSTGSALVTLQAVVMHRNEIIYT